MMKAIVLALALAPAAAFVPANVKAARVAPVEAGSTGSALPLNGWYARGRSGRARAFWRSRPTLCLSLLRRESRAPC